MKELNDQERRFAQELVNGASVSEAARRAGYAETTAKDYAHKWLSLGDTRYKSHLAAYIDELRAKIEAEKIADLQETLEFLTGLMRVKIDQVLEFDGFQLKPKPFDEIPDKIKGLVAGMEYIKGQGTKAVFESKLGAARELMKYHGAYAKDNEQKQPREFTVNVLGKKIE